MAAHVRDTSQETRVKRKTLLEVLEECQKTLEYLSSLDDNDNSVDWKSNDVGDNPSGSSCPYSVVEEVDQLSSIGRDAPDDNEGSQEVALKCESCQIECSSQQKLEQHEWQALSEESKVL